MLSLSMKLVFKLRSVEKYLLRLVLSLTVGAHSHFNRQSWKRTSGPQRQSRLHLTDPKWATEWSV